MGAFFHIFEMGRAKDGGVPRQVGAQTILQYFSFPQIFSTVLQSFRLVGAIKLG
ncbi:hypothetical protein [Burkholderia gladioli]|uniref:hypothetical protein n=1 Tax=Burkholderia gladioli TaxID=28095 RepID=UPI001640016E|nr:hypothetical protein [Burkholderia gladioli]